jgi:hypothetical protein
MWSESSSRSRPNCSLRFSLWALPFLLFPIILPGSTLLLPLLLLLLEKLLVSASWRSYISTVSLVHQRTRHLTSFCWVWKNHAGL